MTAVGRRRTAARRRAAAAAPPRRHDDGTILPLVLGFLLLGIVVVAGGTAASGAFLAQRELSALCDSAAVAAADSADTGALYAGRAVDRLPLSEPRARAEAQGVVDRSGVPGVGVSTRVDGTAVVVTCTRADVPLPLGGVVGVPTTDRTATASARSPLLG